ncbi:MAG: UBA/THIF-type binding protein [Polaromonas sp.]|nr:UBA/THIF-type binding protein [Polaromonas sp.]
MYGAAGAERIRCAHVVIVGLGGVGSWAAEAFARSGVSRITLIDFDHIAESNINRQVHALDSTLGQAKVQAMRQRIMLINSECHVECIEAFVDTENWPRILSLNSYFDPKSVAVIDACDQVKAKIAMATWAIKNNALLISVGAAGGKRLAHRVEIDDLSAVTHDPLLAKIRYSLRKEHGVPRLGKMHLACVFSREAVQQPAVQCEKNLQQSFPVSWQQDSTLNCHGYGSVVSVTSTFGMCAVSWVLNKIAD